LILGLFWGFGLGYGFEFFDGFAYGEFLLVDVDDAWVALANGDSDEVYVVCENHCLPFDGGFDLLFVGLAQFSDVFWGECGDAVSFEAVDDGDVDAFVSVYPQRLVRYGGSSAFLALASCSINCLSSLIFLSSCVRFS
jgi:hypothetical protein